MWKRLLKLCLGIVTLSVIIVIVSIIWNKTVNTEYANLDKTDKKMLKESSAIYKNFEKSSDQLWNKEYSMNDKPLVLIRSSKDQGLIPHRAYVVNVEEMEDSFFAKEIKMPKSFQLPNVYRVNPFHLGAISWVPWNFGTRTIGDTEVFYYKFHPKMMNNPDLYFDFSSFLLHETFHTFKQKAWRYDQNGADHIDSYPENQENYALMGLEFKLLDQAMKETNPNKIKKILYHWTLIRDERYKKWPQLIGETKAEAIEGMARYIEYRYSKLNGGHLMVLATKQKPYHVTFSYAFQVIASGEASSPEFLQRDIRYETGSALGLIMDKAKIDWKDEIEDSKAKPGKTQYEIIKTHLNKNKNESDSARILKELKEKNGYKQLLELGEKIVQHTK